MAIRGRGGGVDFLFIWHPIDRVCSLGSLYVSGKLPTYPSPKPPLTLTFHLGQTVGLGEG